MESARPPLSLLRRLGVVLLDTEYVTRHQLRAAFDRSASDALVDGASDLAPVVLIPGIFETWRFLQPLAHRLHRAGHPVHVLTGLRDNRMSLADGADLLSRYLVAHDLRSVRIVAHSKGGLVAKLAMGMPESAERIERTVAVSTPFQGSSLAAFVPLPSVRALRPGADVIQGLGTSAAVNDRIVSVWGWFDPNIPDGCELEGAARNIRLPVGGHFRILGSPTLLALVDDLVR